MWKVHGWLWKLNLRSWPLAQAWFFNHSSYGPVWFRPFCSVWNCRFPCLSPHDIVSAGCLWCHKLGCRCGTRPALPPSFLLPDLLVHSRWGQWKERQKGLSVWESYSRVRWSMCFKDCTSTLIQFTHVIKMSIEAALEKGLNSISYKIRGTGIRRISCENLSLHCTDKGVRYLHNRPNQCRGGR